MLTFSCASCQKKLSVKEELAGKKVKCPGCGNVTRIPGAAAVTQTPVTGDSRVVSPSRIVDEPTVPPAAEAPAPAPSDKPTLSSLSGSKGTQASISDDDESPVSSLTDFLAPPEAEDELGRLGGFRILKILGHGGMGVVYQGEDPKLGRKVAIKAMLPHLAESKSAQQRFLREARAAAALEHDHIVAIHHVGEDRGAPFIVMPFLKGEPLDARLHRDEELPLGEVLRIGREAAEGLACAHQSGLIHRDIKPANIWLETAVGQRLSAIKPNESAGSGAAESRSPKAVSRVKILDFGLARASSQEAGLTQQGAILGTPSYMAPEQARGETLDARCDLWSLGVVLYQLATGRQPFQGKDAVSTLMAVAMDDPPAPADVNPKLPAELSKLIMRMLEKELDQRIGSAQEIVDALRDLEQGRTPSQEFVPSKTGLRQSPQRTQKMTAQRTLTEGSQESSVAAGAKRSRLPLYLGLGGVLAAAAIAAIFVLRPADEKKVVVVDDSKPPKKDLPVVQASGAALSPLALVQRPAAIPGIESWSIETRGHLGPARQLAPSPDGARFATGGDDGAIRIWDRKAGELNLVRVLLGHETRVHSVEWSPDGKSIASAGSDKAVRLWDPNTGKLVRTLAKHTASVSALRWSPDSKLLASGSHDQSVLLWDVATGESVQKFTSHQAGIIDIGWQSENTLVSIDGHLRVWTWDAKSGNSLKSYVIKSRFWGNFYGWSENRAVLAHKTGEDEVTLWTAATGQTRPLKFKEKLGNLGALAVSPDGKLLATESGPENKALVQIWDADSGRLLSSGMHGGRGVFFLGFSPDSKTVVSTGPYGGSLLWSVDPAAKEASPKELAKPIAVLDTFGHYVWTRWSADSKTIYSKGERAVNLHDVEAAKAKLATTPAGQDASLAPSLIVPAHESGFDAVWSPDSKRLAIRVRPWVTQIWDVDSGKFHVQSMDREGGWPTAWSPDGKTLALGMHDGATLRLWNLEIAGTDRLLQTTGLRGIAWSHDSKQLATVEEKSVRIWDVSAAKDVKSLSVSTRWLTWSPDDQQLVIFAPDGKSVSLWDVKTGLALPTQFEGHKTTIQAVAWSPDGLILATSDDSGFIRMSSAKTGESLKLFKAYQGPAYALVWQDKDTLLSLGGTPLEGNHGGAILVWRPDADKPIREVKGLPARGGFSPDGKLLVPVSTGETLSARWQIWETQTGTLRGTFAFSLGVPDQHLAISADGHFRIVGESGPQVVYVVQTPSGQETLSAEEFGKRFGWKNDPQKVRLANP